MRVWVLCWGLALAGALSAQTATTGEMTAHQAAVASTSLALTVDGKTARLTVADLQAMPQRTVTVHNGHTQAEETYTGVAVRDLLAQHGIAADTTAGSRRVYHSYLRAEGTDHYWVVYSASEVEGGVGGVHKGQVIVALTLDGKPLGDEGRFKLVGSEEQKPARWVRNLQALTLVTVE